MPGAEVQSQAGRIVEHSEAGSSESSSLSVSQDVGSIKKPVRNIARKIAKKVAEDTVRNKLPRFTEILGVFVALFTFVSINIQIFSRITLFNNALIFVTLEFLCLGGFVIILDLIINQKKRWMFIVIVIFFAVLIPMFFFILPRTPLSIEEASKTSDLEQRINILEKRFDDQILRKK